MNDITNRVADMSGLSMESAEGLQVVNYGIGGHYATHFDFATDKDVEKGFPHLGNRIATTLFYVQCIHV